MIDTYLQLEPIKGESTDEKHKDWIEILSFSHSVMQTGSGSVSGGASRVQGKVDMSEFSFSKRFDLSSPYLNKYCCTGKHLDKAVIEICKSTGEKEVMGKYTFENVVISSVSIGGGGDIPSENVSFNFGKVKWEYNQLSNEKGAQTKNMIASHDLVKNVTA